MQEGGQSEGAGLAEAFKIFDRDGSGYISRVELMAALTAVGEPKTEKEIDGILKEFDKVPDSNKSRTYCVMPMLYFRTRTVASTTRSLWPSSRTRSEQ